MTAAFLPTEGRYSGSGSEPSESHSAQMLVRKIPLNPTLKSERPDVVSVQMMMRSISEVFLTLHVCQMGFDGHAVTQIFPETSG